MMTPEQITSELERHQDVFRALLTGVTEEQYRWKPALEKWCLLEIVCHLYDEEREDFRTRVRTVLEDPSKEAPPIDPQGWVKSRKYADQDYESMLLRFLEERAESVNWLRSLKNPKWDHAYVHPRFGPMSARLFFYNWIAHDMHHLRQIVRLKYGYLESVSDESLKYAGDW